GVVFEKKAEQHLVEFTAEAISEGAVIGWFQNRMEYGPRALGARSILADPRRGDIKNLLNEKVKFRERFRPFAPMVKEEKADVYFHMKCESSPFMLKVFPVRESYKSILKGITHVDGSARVQTVSKEVYPKLWNLLDAMERKSEVAVLLNTSFNENEPIVNSPKEALDCFLRTRMDYLIIGSFIVSRRS
ncbi:MAG: carbamoyltransferase, partial [Candidatus Omnitrophica bacterium]|nr:carbamoyltransferase [Candidatus Omnitrophota bacterium]